MTIPVMGGKEAFAFFALMAYAILACLGDAYYTALGQSVGDVESNPIAKFLQQKLGNALAAFVSIAFFIFAAVICFQHQPVGGFAVAGVVAAIETYETFHNKSLYEQGKAAQTKK